MASSADYSIGSGPRALIDRSALRHNLAVVRVTSPNSKVLAVVKANAYGHGIVPVAQALISADGFGVARLSEAVALRDAGIGQPIVLLEGVFSHADLDVVAALQLDIVVHSFAQLDMLESWSGTRRLSVWCKIDTGMNRLGFRAEEFPDAWARLIACRSVQQKPRVMTHLARADERGETQTAEQIARFNALVRDLNTERSIGNSAGQIAHPEARVEWVRPGLMMYGISPFADVDAPQLQLKPAMTLVAQLIACRTVRRGETVGYGGTWQADRDLRLGIATIGYGDGYPRSLASGTPVQIGGQQSRVIGRVSMDMIAIDLEAIPAAGIGDVVTLWGEGLPVEDIARRAGTIPYELVCGISQRVAMEYR